LIKKEAHFHFYYLNELMYQWFV